MEEVLSRFPLIGEEIFLFFDEETLKKCKNVRITWKNFIEDPNQKFKWIQEIKANERNTNIRGNYMLGKNYVDIPLKDFISGPKPKWSNLQIQDLREFVNKINYEKNGSKLIEIFL